MKTPDAFAQLRQRRLLPVAVLDRADDGPRLAEALLAAGLDVIEVTLRTPAALDALRAIRARFPEMLVGAGTLLDPEQVAAAADAGLHFGVSPGVGDAVLAEAAKRNFPITPGVMTPTDIERARAHGLRVLKFFPAEPAGGAKMLAALIGPYGHLGLEFVPTGGITLEKAPAYWALKEVAAVGGSWFVDRKLVQNGDFAQVTALTKAALAARG